MTMSKYTPIDAVLHAINSYGRVTSGSNPTTLTINADNVVTSENVIISGKTIVEWLQTLNGAMGLPTRDLVLEQQYPKLRELWYAAVAETHARLVQNPYSLEYVKLCDQYSTFNILKK